jgi:prepilin-type N-terminal cleavage/methylation domain-containing protein
MGALLDLRDERGLTLIELLVVIVLSLVILFAGTNVLIASVTGEKRERDRAGQIQDARVMIESVSRELRKGYGVELAEPARLTLLTYVLHDSCGGSPATESIACRVAYECAAGTCTRTETDPGGSGTGGTPVETVRGISSDDIFSYEPSAADPGYVSIRLELPAELEGEDAITLEDGVALRNVALGA